MEMSYFSLSNYPIVFENRRLSTHGVLILYLHDDLAQLNNEFAISQESIIFASVLLNYGENHAHIKSTYLEKSIVCHCMALMICQHLQISLIY